MLYKSVYEYVDVNLDYSETKHFIMSAVNYKYMYTAYVFNVHSTAGKHS